MLKVSNYCIFFIFDLGTSMNFILLGDSYLKGNLIIHDVDNRRVGLFPQKMFYPSRDYEESNIFFYIVIILAIGLVISVFFTF